MSPCTPFRSRHDLSDAETLEEINVVLAYENLSAALWATETLTGLLRQIPGGSEPRLSPWSFLTLARPEYRARAMAAAVDADVIVVTTSSGFNLLPAPLESWLQQCLAGRRRAATAVVALFGRANLPDRADSPRLRTVECLAKEAGCAFFAPHVTGAVLAGA